MGNNQNWGNEAVFSYHQKVVLDMGTAGKITNARIIAFHAYGDKHKYDVEVSFSEVLDGLGVSHVVRLYNVYGGIIKSVD